jgi:D-amino-acid dehydrogenase
LPKLAPFLARYWWSSRPTRHAEIARCYAPLIQNSLREHLALVEEAGAMDLIRRRGWIKLFRTPGAMGTAIQEGEALKREFGVDFTALDAKALAEKEPHLNGGLVGGLHWTNPAAVTDPHALTRAYAVLLERLGGKVLTGDAATFASAGRGWRVTTDAGALEAGEAVVALGPWSDLVFRRLGYRIPFAVKRGYHMHYAPAGNAVLNHPVLDLERGYLLAPMAQGIRLTTGAEFAERDAPKTPVQLERAEPVARSLFPLQQRLDPEPWMGARPCTPDMMPVIGPAPRHKGLWFAFGHAHHGLTNGPVTGRLIAEMMTGATPFIDPKPYRADRF